MHLPILIKCYCIPKDNAPYHPPTIADEKHEMILLGFIKLELNEQETFDFPEDLLHDWETYASPTTTSINTTPLDCYNDRIQYWENLDIEELSTTTNFLG